MLSCAREVHVLCFKSILVAYLGVGALCCLKVVVAGCGLGHFGSRLAVGLPQGFLVSWLLPKPYWAHLTFLGRSEGFWDVLTSPDIKSSHL